MDADSLRTPFLDVWEELKKDQRGYAVIKALSISPKWPILMVVLPRSILIGLTICQPILLNWLLDYLTESSEPKEKDIGCGLIGAYALVYFGIAMATGFYWYYHYRVLTMIRGCLVSAIGVKTLQLNTHSAEDPKAAVTLMSTDVERIIFGLRSFHEFWANAIQAGFLAFLLERQLGTLLWHFPALSDEPRETTCEKKYHPEQTIIEVTNGSFGWKDDRDVLHNINITIPRGQSTFIVGPVASGKSTLCHALLGETPISRGKVEIFTDAKNIGFCRQTPHLTNGTVQQNIIGFSIFQPRWYNTVVKACALVTDIDSLPRGNETIVGSDGLNLSGGQKQKIAIARALYALKPILLFDDVLSGLDYTRASHIFREVIGPKGLAQQHGITVIIATHATEYLPFADHIIALDKSGQVIQQGSFQSLRSSHP
ncbi:ABC multidrug transporter [Trichophyton violaceum]|uniref:ABC multidrug transporter n=1 Tax=Trichophyton violaceum TaxID=34388 RepID=A0A178FJT7_TRIVO|nr:ABC multidrug transporter [Trichophyton violaceum]